MFGFNYLLDILLSVDYGANIIVTPKFMGQDLVPSPKYIEKPKSIRDVQALSGVPQEHLDRTVSC